MPANEKLLTEVAALYNWLDSQTSCYNQQNLCCACGKCCNFTAFDHRLFVTPPELIYLAAGLNEKQLMKMSNGTCPYNKVGRCTIYNYRFAGCRIFSCKADKDFQSALSESTLSKLKSICERFNIPYTYSDLKTALASFTA
jgi:Fe-S-cluster containining protein